MQHISDNDIISGFRGLVLSNPRPDTGPGPVGWEPCNVLYLFSKNSLRFGSGINEIG